MPYSATLFYFYPVSAWAHWVYFCPEYQPLFLFLLRIYFPSCFLVFIQTMLFCEPGLLLVGTCHFCPKSCYFFCLVARICHIQPPFSTSVQNMLFCPLLIQPLFCFCVLRVRNEMWDSFFIGLFDSIVTLTVKSTSQHLSLFVFNSINGKKSNAFITHCSWLILHYVLVT